MNSNSRKVMWVMLEQGGHCPGKQGNQGKVGEDKKQLK